MCRFCIAPDSTHQGLSLIGIVVGVGVVNIDGDGNVVTTLDGTSSNSAVFVSLPAERPV